jgi:hypothetical protein
LLVTTALAPAPWPEPQPQIPDASLCPIKLHLCL